MEIQFKPGDKIQIDTIRSSNGIKSNHTEMAVVVEDNKEHLCVKIGKMKTSYEKKRIPVWEKAGYPIKFTKI